MDWSDVKQHYGNIASVAGLVVSVLGFSFTLYQVRKSRTAAERAQAMAREAIEQASSQLFFTQIATAVRLVHEVRSFCRARDWDRAVSRCEELHSALAGVVDNSKLHGEERKSVSTAIDDLSIIMRHLHRIDQAKTQPTLSTRMINTLDRVVISLTRIDGRLRRAPLEVKNG